MLSKLIAGVIVELTPYVPTVLEKLSEGISDLYYDWFENDTDYNSIKEMSDDEIQLKRK